MPLHAIPHLTHQLTASLRLIDPDYMSANLSFLRQVTKHTGGTPDALDSIDTSRLTLPYFANALITRSDGEKEVQGFIARARLPGENETAPGTNPEDWKYTVPDNWHVTDNNVIWERKQ